MEGAVPCSTAKRAIVFSVGTFGNRWFEIAQGNGVSADKHEVTWGEAAAEMIDEHLSTGKYDCATLTHSETSTGVMNHLAELAPVFRKYPDVGVVHRRRVLVRRRQGRQRRPGHRRHGDLQPEVPRPPPGLSLCTMSPKAEKRAQSVKNRGYYFDLLQLLQFIREKNFQYPSTMSISHMFALDAQTDRILKEGIDARFARHDQMAERVQDWAKKYFASTRSRNTPRRRSPASRTPGALLADLNKELGKRNLTMSNGTESSRSRRSASRTWETCR